MYGGRIWKGDILVADIEELETMDASEIYPKRLNAKDLFTPMNGDNLRRVTFTFSGYFVADGSFTADGGLLQSTGGVKTTPHKSISAV